MDKFKKAMTAYARPAALKMLVLGFASGLPLLLVFSTLSAWLTDFDIKRATIGYLSWVTLTYTFKFVWSPVVDALRLPLLFNALGQRRSWMFLSQIMVALGLALMAFQNLPNEIVGLALFALWTAFWSATQDIAIDAYRIEITPTEELGAGAATYQLGYRISNILAGAGALLMAGETIGLSWMMVYLIMGLCMALTTFATLMFAEPEIERVRPAGYAEWIEQAVFKPFQEFFVRNGALAFLILLFIAFFRFSDVVLGPMAMPFYLDMGYSKEEVAAIIKIFGVWMTIAGAFAGGFLVDAVGQRWALIVSVCALAISNLAYTALALMPEHTALMLTALISIENIAGGLAGTVFIAYLSSLTSLKYTATQYALFSSLMLLPGKLLGGFSGLMVEKMGYPHFFILTAILGVPALILAIILLLKTKEPKNNI